MNEDLGRVTGIEFTVFLTPEINEYFHKGVTGTMIINDESYNMKVKSRRRNGNELRVRGELIE